MLEVFQPGCLSCAVGLTWLVAVGAHTCAGRQAAPLHSPQKEMSTQGTNWLSQRTAADEIIASRNAALPLPWSPGDRQRSALGSILDYVMQVTGVTPK